MIARFKRFKGSEDKSKEEISIPMFDNFSLNELYKGKN